MPNPTIPYYEQQAIRYAERYGIIEYAVKGSTMTHTEDFPGEQCRYTATVDLEQLKEVRRTCQEYAPV